jgi:hypothetical protein
VVPLLFPGQKRCNNATGGFNWFKPISAGGEEGLGEEGAFMLEVGISSTRRIARFWGLAP